MIQNAIKAYKFFEVSTFEKLSEEISYSIDTINYFNKEYETSSLRLIMGEDNFHNFTSWHRYLEILSMASIIVLCRDNDSNYARIELLDSYIEKNINLFNQSKSGKIHLSNTYKSQISGSLLRDMIKKNQPIRLVKI